MQNDSTTPFVDAVKPLFRKRAIYRTLASIIVAASVFWYKDWVTYFLAATLPLLAIVAKLIDIEQNLADVVWKRFAEQLDTTSYEPVASLAPLPPASALSKVGDVRNLRLLARGDYRNYPVRLLEEEATFNDESGNGSYTCSFRVLEITTKQNFYHVYVDSKKNNLMFPSTSMHTLSRCLRTNESLEVEGDVNKYFKIFVPEKDNFKSLVTLSPEKLLALRDYGKGFDIEFVDNKVLIISNRRIRNIKDVLMYQETILDIVENIGVDVVRHRKDVSDHLKVSKPKGLVV